jgi:uncharacterized protein
MLVGVPALARVGGLPRGELLPPDANGVRLLAGFASRIVARSGRRPVAGGRYPWHGAPDGGACFAAADGGWIYVSNSELEGGTGGASALRFDAQARVVDAYRILRGTTANCAGGATPWGTWLSCEEFERGRVWECDPLGQAAAVPRPALGAFKHEAVAFDDARGHVYLTEDDPAGCLYRYVAAGRDATGRLDLDRGALEVATVEADGAVRWMPLHDARGRGQATRDQVRGATRFRGGEGIWFADGLLHFSTKHDGRIWRYDVATQRLGVLYDMVRHPAPILKGVYNLTMAPGGELLVAEDGDDMQVVAIRADGTLQAVLQVPTHKQSEIAGIAFDPSGTRLYFSSQRGASGRNGDGVTYEVSGPFGGT